MRFLVGFSIFLAVAAASAGWAEAIDKRQVPAHQVAKTSVAAPAPESLGSSIADPARFCETATATVEFAARLPPRLLQAVSVTETGRADAVSGQLRPWPWTINAEGVGQFFETKQQAVKAVKALLGRGVQSIDVGCMQVNLRYHPKAFTSLEDAFDPRLNAGYAARFLNQLYAEQKSWAHAIAAYHSETPVLGEAYRVLVMTRWQNGERHETASAPVIYRDFIANDQVYGAFAPRSRVYGSFAAPAGGR